MVGVSSCSALSGFKLRVCLFAPTSCLRLVSGKLATPRIRANDAPKGGCWFDSLVVAGIGILLVHAFRR